MDLEQELDGSGKGRNAIFHHLHFLFIDKVHCSSFNFAIIFLVMVLHCTMCQTGMFLKNWRHGGCKRNNGICMWRVLDIKGVQIRNRKV